MATVNPFQKGGTSSGAGGAVPGTPPVIGPYKPTGEDAGGSGPIGGRTNPPWSMKSRFAPSTRPVDYGRQVDKEGVE
ncbi:MAG TPA: hypothetical protein VK667_07755 [Ktedonobacteraceae bacterium]|nr:hypothetical protein [Ktedonobacteraceae bacterium]